jgi:hypothetical protein
VRFTDFSAFTFDPEQDVLLHLRPERSWLWLLLAGGFLAALVFIAQAMADPNWNPGRSSKGAWVLLLLLLLPAALRVALMIFLIGFLAEGLFRQANRIFDSRPDFVIGPAGVADLNPWSPQAILWDDITGITRALSSPSLFSGRQETVSIHFRAPGKKPAWIARWLWTSLPAWITERHIVLFPNLLGMKEEEIFQIVERFGGRYPMEVQQTG